MPNPDTQSVLQPEAVETPRIERDVRTQCLHIVLPAFNEAEGIGKMLQDFQQHLQSQRFSYTVTVVDDGSSDETREVVIGMMDQMPVEVIVHEQNQGLAAAMRTGLRAAAKQSRGEDIILTMDSDNTHPIGLIPRMVERLNEGRDIVIASRFQHGSRILGVPYFRQLTGRAVGVLFQVLFSLKDVRDYTCGFRVYRSQVLRAAFREHGDQFISEEGFSCMVDILLKLSRKNLIMSEVPMVLRYDLKEGASKMNVGSTIMATLRLALKRRLGVQH